jgi:hypothetical protein
MAGKEVTEEEMLAIRKAVRAGKTAQVAADELKRPIGTVRMVARRLGCPFPRGGSPLAGTRGPYSEERRAAMRAGVLAAKARREGMGDGL